MMARRSSSIAFRFYRLYLTRIPYNRSNRQAYYDAEEIWLKQYGRYCYKNYMSFANSASRFYKQKNNN